MKKIILSVALLVFTALFSDSNIITAQEGNNTPSYPGLGKGLTAQDQAVTPDCVYIGYDNLVDKSIITHSGETVGTVLQKITNYNDSYKGLVQPYMGALFFIVPKKIQSIKNDANPFVNILTHYSVGSEQPAWVALFREGYFQLYYNKHTIRVFLKGNDPKSSFQNSTQL